MGLGASASGQESEGNGSTAMFHSYSSFSGTHCHCMFQWHALLSASDKNALKQVMAKAGSTTCACVRLLR